tara:strand:- start:74 stop:1198 length:1125 start_codon:yes stop_codon:yes gene_type:complete
LIKKYKVRTKLKSLVGKAAKDLAWIKSRIQKYINSYKKPRIKLVAIAKNEACYLPEWIFHHLHFGFDSIDIYVNNTSDNTLKIAKKLEGNSSIMFHDGDAFFKPEIDVPQVEIYKYELNLSKSQGFTHVMFLDIDEFWTPLDLSVSIQDYIKKFTADIICFEWVNRTNEPSPFLPALNRVITGIKGNHIKSLVGTHVLVEGVNPHNVLAYKASYQLADGSKFVVKPSDFAKVDYEQIKKPIKDAVIIHRMYRSQEEYVALLARGRPIQNRQFADVIKTNRNGYSPKYISAKLFFNIEKLEKYNLFKKDFFIEYELEIELEEAKKFIDEKKNEMILFVENAPKEYWPILKRVLQRINIKEVKDSLLEFKSKNNIK